MLQLHLALLMKLKLQRKLSRLESNMVTTGAQVSRLCEEVAAVAAGVAGAEHPTRAGIQCRERRALSWFAVTSHQVTRHSRSDMLQC